MRTQGNSPSPPATTGAFDLSGGRPCLDFANTVEDRPGEARDRLATVLADPTGESWMDAAGLLDGDVVLTMGAGSIGAVSAGLPAQLATEGGPA